jgi:aminoglycoside phosphotransferase (APT) family kinase protein
MQMPVAATADPSGIDKRCLLAWMDDRGLGSGEIRNMVSLTGGTQNILMQFERGGDRFVLRRPPIHLRANSNDTMQREARVLGALRETGIPHPKLIADCGDGSVLGASFYLMEPVEGFNATQGLPALHAGDPTIRRRMGFAMVEGIAALGSLDYKSLHLNDFGNPDNFLQRQVARWASQLDSYRQFARWPGPGGLPGIDSVAEWLEANCPRHFGVGILHGDFHIANVMFQNSGAELAAIVDWELATIGAPLLDLGWLLATWPESEAEASVSPWSGFPDPAELVSCYRQNSRHSPDDIVWYGVLACYKLGILLEGTHARACDGKAPKVVGGRLHAKAVSLFRRAHAWSSSSMVTQ